jgi:hypothetical protein
MSRHLQLLYTSINAKMINPIPTVILILLNSMTTLQFLCHSLNCLSCSLLCICFAFHDCYALTDTGVAVYRLGPTDVRVIAYSDDVGIGCNKYNQIWYCIAIEKYERSVHTLQIDGAKINRVLRYVSCQASRTSLETNQRESTKYNSSMNCRSLRSNDKIRCS